MSPDENVGPTLLAITGVVTFLVLATTAARIYVRVKTHNTGWDDYLIVAAAILATLRFAFQVVSVPHGFGRHAQYVDPHDVVQGNKWSVFGLLVLFPAICFVKMSIILLLLRIKNDRWLKIVLGVVVVGLVVTNFGTVFTIIGQCHPLSAWWNNIADCGDVRIRLYWIYTTVAYSVFTDLVCSILPLLIIFQMQCMAVRTKIALWCLMSLGLITTGFGVARAAALGVKTQDLTWVYAVAAIWTNLELFLGIIAANLALSRSMYTFFRYGKKSSQVPTPAVPTAGAFSVQVNTAHSDDVDVEKESSSMRSGTKPSLQTLTQQNSGTSD